MLLGREAAHVSDDQLAVRREPPAQRVVTRVRPEPNGVHAPAPELYARHTVGLQVLQRGAGRGECAVGGAVHGPDPAPCRRLARVHVGAGVAGEVGLVDGDGGQAEPGGGRHAAVAEDEGAGQMDDLGAVGGDGGGDSCGWAVPP